MTREEYLNKRQKLYDEAKAMLDKKETGEAYKGKLAEIEQLDTDYKNEITAAANLAALEKNAVVTAEPMLDSAKPFDVSGNTAEHVTAAAEAEAYKNAFAKHFMGLSLTEKEQAAFANANPDFYNNAMKKTDNPVVIPETVSKDIWTEIGEMHPIIADVHPTYVKGKLSILKDKNSGTDGKWYDEDDESEDGEEKVGAVVLDGCELVKSIPVTWKLKKMSIDQFLNYIIRKISERMGNALAHGYVTGKGKPGTGETFKPEPWGVRTRVVNEEGTPQVVAYTEAKGIKYDDIVKAFGKVKSGYTKIVYAKSETIWNQLATIKDTTGRPIFIPSPDNSGIGRLFGTIIKEEDAVPLGELLVGDMARGYAANINEEITLDEEDHKKKRFTDYLGYAIVDGDVMTTKAFAVLKKEETVA